MQRRFTSFLGASIIAAGLLLGTEARATIISETFSFAEFSGYRGESGTSFAQFNPTLGTLNSVTVDFAVTADFFGGGANDINKANYSLNAGDVFNILFQVPGNTAAGEFTQLAAPSLTPFIGTGSVTTSVNVTNAGGTHANISSTFLDQGIGESVTYDYTPVSASVPEPGTLALFSAGLIGLMGLLRRRQRKALTAA